MPATLTLDGVPYGYPGDGTPEKDTCDQIAAVGPDGVIRGVSTPIQQGHALGWIATAGEQMAFKYWNGEQQQEHDVQFKTTMEQNLALGGFGAPQVLVLSKAKGPPKRAKKAKKAKKANTAQGQKDKDDL